MALVRVLLAGAMHMLRGALVALLAAEDDFEIVADVQRLDQIGPVGLDSRPDIAVIDIDGYGEEKLDRIAALHVQLPSCPVVLLTGCRIPAILQRLVAARTMGLISKDAAPRHLAESIRKVVRGEPVVDPLFTIAVLTSTAVPLTARERDVLRIAAEGATAAEIATQLGLSLGTVRNYLSVIIRKTGARSRVDAIRIAADSGWLPE